MGSEEIRLESDDDPCLVEAIAWKSDVAKESAFGLPAGMIGTGLPLDVAQSRHGLDKPCDERLAARRDDSPRDQQRALARALPQSAGEPIDGRVPAHGASVLHGLAHAVRIVEAQQIGGTAEAGLAPVQGMLVVALDVDGAALARLHQDRIRNLALLEGAGIVVRDARDDLFLLLRVRNDGRAVLGRLAARTGGQRRGSAEQGQEAPAGNAVVRPGVGATDHGKLDDGLAVIHVASPNR